MISGLGREALWNLTSIVRYASPLTAARYLGALLTQFGQVLRDRDFASVDNKMRGTLCKFKPQEAEPILLPGEYFGLAREIYCRQVYFLAPDFRIGSEDTVVDLGANVGVFTLLAAKYGKKVLAVEAQSDFLPLLERNLELNECADRVAIEHCLVGSGTGHFASSRGRREASHWGTDPEEVTLEQILTRHSISQIDFLKIDIEGSEFALFEEDTSWLQIVRRVALEVHPEHGSVTALSNKLAQAGFEQVLKNSDGRTISEISNHFRSGFLFGRRASPS